MQNHGFIALVTILIISAVALLIGSSLSFFSLGESQMSLQKSQSSQASFLVNSCAEEALIKLKEDSNYSGDEIINLEEGLCQILPIEGNWTLKVLADYSNQIKKVRVVINRVNPAMEIASWQEVTAF